MSTKILIASFVFFFVLSAMPVRAGNGACHTANYLVKKLHNDYLITVILREGKLAKYKLHISNINFATGHFSYDLLTSTDKIIMKDAQGKLKYKFMRFTIPVNMGNNWMTFFDCNGVISDDGASVSDCILFERNAFLKQGCTYLPKVDIQVVS